MAELHSNIYYKHEDPEIMDMLDSLFKEPNGDTGKFTLLCESINSENGAKLSKELIAHVYEPQSALRND